MARDRYTSTPGPHGHARSPRRQNAPPAALPPPVSGGLARARGTALTNPERILHSRAAKDTRGQGVHTGGGSRAAVH
jgi:hypothetical protein